MSRTEQLKKQWGEQASKLLVGRKIVKCEYMSKALMHARGWHKAPLVIHLDDGTTIYPSMDDEGNAGGSLFTNDENFECAPTI